MRENQRRKFRLVERAAPIFPGKQRNNAIDHRSAHIENHSKDEKLQKRRTIFGPDEGRQEGKHEDDDFGIEQVDQNPIPESRKCAALLFHLG